MIHRNLLKKVKRANKVRKMKLAKENGFDNIEDYIQHLESNLEELPENIELPTIHIVHILDSSGSMFDYGREHKFDKSAKGIMQEINSFKERKDANYVVSVYEFSNSLDCLIDSEDIFNIIDIKWLRMKRTTHLNDTIGTVLTKLIKDNDTSIKVLVKVFTDGEDVGSNTSILHASKIINSLPDNITFTFVAAEGDKSYISQYEIEESNLLFHNNTSKGVEDSFNTSFLATSTYITKVKQGENVVRGFYKNIIKK